MSSMRNAVQRRNHRERAQPFERQKKGILEKHKDYQLRSRDYNAKKARLKILRSKASERNPDEFYFAMTSSTTHKGVHVASRGNTSLSVDAVRLLKTQDAGYLRIASAIERNKRQKLEEELHFMGEEEDAEEIGRKHTIFLESRQEVESFKPEEYFDTDKDLVGRAWNRPRLSQLENDGLKQGEWIDDDDTAAARARRSREKKYKELEARMKREEELKLVERQLDEQREKMNKGGGVSGVTKSGKRFVVKARRK